MSLFPAPGAHPFTVAIPAPGPGPQQWAGAPSAAILDDGTFIMLRRSGDEGDCVIIAMSSDGKQFETVAIIENEQLGSAMTERPALIRMPGERWRVYTSHASHGDLFWKIGLLEADSLSGLAEADHRTIFHGGESTMVKDPVVKFDGTTRHAWICCHLRDADDEWDGMGWQVPTRPVTMALGGTGTGTC